MVTYRSIVEVVGVDPGPETVRTSEVGDARLCAEPRAAEHENLFCGSEHVGSAVMGSFINPCLAEVVWPNGREGTGGDGRLARDRTSDRRRHPDTESVGAGHDAFASSRLVEAPDLRDIDVRVRKRR